MLIRDRFLVSLLKVGVLLLVVYYDIVRVFRELLQGSEGLVLSKLALVGLIENRARAEHLGGRLHVQILLREPRALQLIKHPRAPARSKCLG